jgi:hypothetical protein
MLLRNLVAPGIESGTSGLAARNCDHQTTEAAILRTFIDLKTESRNCNSEWAPGLTQPLTELDTRDKIEGGFCGAERGRYVRLTNSSLIVYTMSDPGCHITLQAPKTSCADSFAFYI